MPNFEERLAQLETKSRADEDLHDGIRTTVTELAETIGKRDEDEKFLVYHGSILGFLRKPFYRKLEFLSGIFVLPAVLFGSAFLSNIQGLEGLPAILHRLLGTEAAIKSYLENGELLEVAAGFAVDKHFPFLDTGFISLGGLLTGTTEDSSTGAESYIDSQRIIFDARGARAVTFGFIGNVVPNDITLQGLIDVKVSELANKDCRTDQREYHECTAESEALRDEIEALQTTNVNNVPIEDFRANLMPVITTGPDSEDLYPISIVSTEPFITSISLNVLQITLYAPEIAVETMPLGGADMAVLSISFPPNGVSRPSVFWNGWYYIKEVEVDD